MRIIKTEVFNAECNPSSTMVNIRVFLNEDLSDMLPYLNATQEKAKYYPSVPYLNFLWKGCPVNLREATITAFGFESDTQARSEAELIVSEIKRVVSNRAGIEPDETPYSPPPVLDILKNLPRIPGCSDCGQGSCMAFAAAVSRGDCHIGECFPLQADDYSDNRSALAKLMGQRTW
jgi:ArsR family metal-binding transcriptional regulator